MNQASSAMHKESVTQENLQKQHNKLILILGIALLLSIIAIGILSMQRVKPDAVVLSNPTPIEMSTPTPTPNVSNIATTSAFAAYSQEIASFSATINTFSLQDSTLAPPILDLNLGLTE